ncbi:MAG: methyltransferase [Muribaculaceae bacterium]|nr:methyltransferase [Muribaculaceae bacterium]
MSKHNQPFKFKQFEVSHHRSSMKVGVDAVILGSWADITDASSILDVGCGCGVISLMCAQRNPKAEIMAIDIDRPSIEEALDNFNSIPWRERLYPILSDFAMFCLTYKSKIDYIISNPPYFDSGIDNPATVREKARHQGTLSPKIIIEKGRGILSSNGKIGMVIPIDQAESIKKYALSLQMSVCRELIMKGREGREPKRVFIEFSIKSDRNPETESLTLEKEDGEYTEEYRTLCHDFYLKF